MRTRAEMRSSGRSVMAELIAEIQSCKDGLDAVCYCERERIKKGREERELKERLVEEDNIKREES